jgi:hypothetical protein
MAIALVTVPPDEKSLAKYTSFGLQRTADYCSHHPSPPYFRRGVADDGDEPDLGPNRLSLCWVRSHPHHRSFACGSYSWNTTASMLMCPD